MSGLPAFQRVLDHHGPAVWRYCVRSVGPDAADVYQETVLAALRRYPDLRDPSGVRPWLFTIAHSRVVDAHRDRDRRPVSMAVPPEGAGAAPEPRDEALWAAVATLPARQRTCVTLRYVGDLSHAEVAQITGGTEAASRQNTKAGLDRLRQLLDEETP